MGYWELLTLGIVITIASTWAWFAKRVTPSPTGRPLAAPQEYQRRWKDCRTILKDVKNNAGKVNVGEMDRDTFVRWCYDLKVP